MSFISSLEPSQASGANQTWTFCGWNSVYLWPNLASWLWAWKVRWCSLDIRSVLPDKPLIGSNMNTTWRLTCCQNLLGPTHRNKYMVPGSVHFECCLPHPGRQYLRFLPDTVEIGSSHSPSTPNKYSNGFLWRLFDNPVEWGSWRNLDICFEPGTNKVSVAFRGGSDSFVSMSEHRLASKALCLNAGAVTARCVCLSDRGADERPGEDPTGAGRHKGTARLHTAVPGGEGSALGQPPNRKAETAGGDPGDEVSTHFCFLVSLFWSLFRDGEGNAGGDEERAWRKNNLANTWLVVSGTTLLICF